jgi:Carboxypeptidase regulatory-like domain
MKTNREILKIGCVIVLLSGLGNAASVRGQLVYASNGAPAPYVAVRLSVPGKTASEFAYSGVNGKYYLRNVPAGTYQLEVWRGGKMVLTVAVTVQEPDTELALTHVP